MYVGFIYNSPTERLLLESPELTMNLTDEPETIRAVKRALEAGGHTVIPLNADHYLPAFLTACRFDIVFNTATGFYGDTRPANVPAMLEYLRIPHTGPGVLAETITHHKPIMKVLLLARGVPTPAFQTFYQADDPLKPDLRFPLIVKLPAESGSLGLDSDSVVYNEADLRARVALLLDRYAQGALVEEYIDGREFTVSVLGNNPPYTLPIVERVYYGAIRIQLDEPEPSTLELYKRITGEDIPYTPVDTESIAPAAVTEAEAQRIRQVALAAYHILGCQDWARIDLRMDSQGNVYVLDVNPEPAIAPDYGLAKAAHAAGWTYEELVNRILNHAVERYPLLRQPLPPVNGKKSPVAVPHSAAQAQPETYL